MNIKEQCLKLKSENPKMYYKEIAKIVGCQPSTVCYHLNEDTRKNYRHRQSKNRRINNNALKSVNGGKCKLCGYCKSLSALHFHHLDPDTKTDEVSRILRTRGKLAATNEAKKCILICANCHHEIHDGLIKLE